MKTLTKLMYCFIPSAFGFLLLTIVTGFAYDIQRQADVRPTPAPGA